MIRRALFPAVFLSALITAGSGCATIVGTIAGPITNGIDMPRRVLAENREALQRSPEYVSVAVVVFVPIGIVTGPLLGFAKGLYVDICSGLRDDFDYSDAWGFGPESVWRPATFGTKSGSSP